MVHVVEWKPKEEEPDAKALRMAFEERFDGSKLSRWDIHYISRACYAFLKASVPELQAHPESAEAILYERYQEMVQIAIRAGAVSAAADLEWDPEYAYNCYDD